GGAGPQPGQRVQLVAQGIDVGKASNSLVQLVSVSALDMQSFGRGNRSDNLLERLFAEVSSVPGMRVQQQFGIPQAALCQTNATGNRSMSGHEATVRIEPSRTLRCWAIPIRLQGQ